MNENPNIPTKKYHILQNIGYMISFYKKEIPIFLWMCLFEILLGSMIPYLEIYLPKLVVELVTKRYTMQQAIRSMVFFGLFFVTVKTVKGGCEQGKYFLYNGKRNDIAAMLFLKSLRIPFPDSEEGNANNLYWKALHSIDSGDYSAMYRFSYDTVNILINLICFFLYSTVLGYLNLWIMILLLVLSLLQYTLCISEVRYMERYRDRYAQFYKKRSYLHSVMGKEEAAKDIRIFSMKQWLNYHNDVLISLKRGIDKEKMTREKIYWQAGSLLALGRDLFAYIYLIRQAQAGIIDAGEFVLYFGAITGFAVFVNSIMTSFASLQEGNISLNHLRSYLELEEEDVYSGSHSIQELQMPVSFTFRNVSFRYSLKEEDAEGKAEDPGQWIFRHLNLTIHGGEKIAIVGTNGAGKTTLVKLLCGLYEPQEGEILVNGIPIREFPKEELYKLYAAVFQEPFIMPFTLGENLALSKDYDKEQCISALEEAGLRELFEKRGYTLDTYFGKDMGEDGIELSGGQKQKFLLARALYKDAPVLILDEPTAALDPIAESEIYDEYAKLSKDKTAIFISHRLASTRFSDRILLIGNQGILEEGTHEELLKNCEVYLQIAKSQLSEKELGLEKLGLAEEKAEKETNKKEILSTKIDEKENNKLKEKSDDKKLKHKKGGK